MKKTITYNLDQIDTVVDYLVSLMPNCSIFTFTGPLGAGKTTLIKALLKKLGVQEPVVSPTFTYLNVYTNKEGKKFYHFDLYRLHSKQDFIDSGFNEYLGLPKSAVFIEWPEVIYDLLGGNACHITIDYDNDFRKVLIELGLSEC